MNIEENFVMRTTLAGLALALVAVVGSSARAQNANNPNDRDAGKRETIRGVIAGVTVAGETAIDYTTRRAQTVEMTYLTVVGSPVRDSASNESKNADKGRDNAGDRDRRAEGSLRRHNVYIVWLSPKTEVRDATVRDATARDANNSDKDRRSENAGAQGKPATLDALEVGDTVRLTFTRREFSRSGEQQQVSKHGRHRTYFGDATSITILSEPDRQRDGDRTTPNDRDRDDDKDKVKDNADKNNNKK
jgi:hypothetical protein